MALSRPRLESYRNPAWETIIVQHEALTTKVYFAGGPREAPGGKVFIELHFMLRNSASGLEIGPHGQLSDGF